MDSELPPSPLECPRVQLVDTELNGQGLGRTFSAVSRPQLAAQVIQRLIGRKDREHFVALLLNAGYEVTHAHIVARGTISSALVHPREVFKAAILANAAALIVGHNHPSGKVQPSTDDKVVTERLKSAGELLGINVLDALIVSAEDRYYIFSVDEERRLPEAKVEQDIAPTLRDLG